MTTMRSNAARRLWASGLAAIVLLVSGMVALAAPTAAVDAPIYAGITIDGLADDWAGVPSTTTTLIRPMATTQRIVDGLEWSVAHDDANIYFLFLVNDDFDYNATNHDLSAAIAVLFQIDAAATPDMGGGLGNVDIWHWELDCGPGELSGFNLLSGNDPPCNLDDEWASSTTNRFDDGGANEVYGAWSHTGMPTPGATGQWIFEMKRSLKTADTLNQDYQFSVGTTAKMAFAYWDADETPAGWLPEGHYSSCRDPVNLNFNWIDIDLEAPPDIDAMKAEITALQSEIDALQAEVGNQSADIDGLEADIADLQAQIDALTTALAAAQADADAAQTTADAAKTSAEGGTTMTYVAVILAVVALVMALVSMMRKGTGKAPKEET